MRPVIAIDPDSYSRHPLHSETSAWTEKNCYVDLWIELLHALHLEPSAMMPFTVAVDFEGDQWTFYKPSHDEMRDLYGVDVQELTIWRPLIEHAVEHLSAGRLISTEMDAFWLPDTSGTDYRTKHTKTTIVLNDLDIEARRLGYFHNAGYFRLTGEDFDKVFRVDSAPDPTFMPLFAESVRIDRIIKRDPASLVLLCKALWKKHLARIPETDPILRFEQRFIGDLPNMQEQGLAYYHAWAFATTRQLGSAFELAAQNLRWLRGHGQADLEHAIAAFESVSSECKTFILKGARAINSRRPIDSASMFENMRLARERGISLLKKAFTVE